MDSQLCSPIRSCVSVVIKQVKAQILLIFVFINNMEHTILIIVQRDATQSTLFISLQVHFTCFGCQPHPSSGAHKTVTTASGTVQLPSSNVAKLGHVGGR